jgi:hypothetical protein
VAEHICTGLKLMVRTELLGFCKITCTKLEEVKKNVVADCHP